MLRCLVTYEKRVCPYLSCKEYRIEGYERYLFIFFFWINRNAKGEYRNSTQVVSQEEFLYREKIKISILFNSRDPVQFIITLKYRVSLSIEIQFSLVSISFCSTLFDEHDRLTRHVQSEPLVPAIFQVSRGRKEEKKRKKKKGKWIKVPEYSREQELAIEWRDFAN